MKKKELVDKKGEIEIQGGDGRTGSSRVERRSLTREGAKQEREPPPAGG